MTTSISRAELSLLLALGASRLAARRGRPCTRRGAAAGAQVGPARAAGAAQAAPKSFLAGRPTVRQPAPHDGAAAAAAARGQAGCRGAAAAAATRPLPW